MINLENYESYLFLYQEGELDSSTCLEVERFLLEHPDIREEMETYYDPSLVVTAEPPVQQKQRKGGLLWRWVAAACVVLAMGWGAYLILPSQSEEGITVAKVSTPEIQKPTQTVETTNTTIKTTNTATTIEATNSVTVPATPSVSKPTVTQVSTAANNIKPVPQDNPTTDPNLMAANQPKAMEEEKTTQKAEQPLPYPTLVESQQLAQVNEIIIVNNLAEEIPAERQTQQPSVLMQLARNIRKNIDGTKQDIQDFLYGLASSRGSEELADASLTNE